MKISFRCNQEIVLLQKIIPLKITLFNSELTATINSIGAELISLKNQSNREFIWEGNPEYWGKHSPILFPIVGSLENDSYQFNTTTYHLPRHGFAREMNFEIIEKTEDKAVYSLKQSANTLEKYPFNFELQISYTLINSVLKIEFKVTNNNNVTMPFSIGAHPAFSLANDFENYELVFEKSENLIVSKLENDLISNTTYTLPIENNSLPLSYSLFENDALIFKTIESKSVSIAENNIPFLRVSYKDFSSLGIWTKNQAPFVCIEPWLGYADTLGNNGNLEDKEGIQILGVNQTFETNYLIEIL
jgi:galactose mutarotase-like enzyme